MGVQEVRFARTARKHRIGKARVLHVMENTEPQTVPAGENDNPDELLVWIGDDNRGTEIEVVAAVKPDCLLVIHAMPTHYRRS